jgi:hypothetical protein
MVRPGSSFGGLRTRTRPGTTSLGPTMALSRGMTTSSCHPKRLGPRLMRVEAYRRSGAIQAQPNGSGSGIGFSLGFVSGRKREFRTHSFRVSAVLGAILRSAFYCLLLLIFFHVHGNSNGGASLCPQAEGVVAGWERCSNTYIGLFPSIFRHIGPRPSCWLWT